MTQKEKAKDLVDKFFNEMPKYLQGKLGRETAKESALICVKEIGLYRRQIEREYDEDLYHAYGVEEYWKEKRKEINKAIDMKKLTREDMEAILLFLAGVQIRSCIDVCNEYDIWS